MAPLEFSNFALVVPYNIMDVTSQCDVQEGWGYSNTNQKPIYKQVERRGKNLDIYFSGGGGVQKHFNRLN